MKKPIPVPKVQQGTWTKSQKRNMISASYAGRILCTSRSNTSSKSTKIKQPPIQNGRNVLAANARFIQLDPLKKVYILADTYPLIIPKNGKIAIVRPM